MRDQIRVLNALLTCRQQHKRWLEVVMGEVGERLEGNGKVGWWLVIR